MLIALVQIGNMGLLRLSEISAGATNGTGVSQQGDLEPDVEGNADGSGQVNLSEAEVIWVLLESSTHQLEIEYRPDSASTSTNMFALGDSRSDNRGTQALFRNSGPVNNGRFIVGNLSADTDITLTIFADALFVSQHLVQVSVARPEILIRRGANGGSIAVVTSE